MATFELCEAGCWYTTVEAASAAEALEIAKGNVDRANYSDCDGTIFIDVRAHGTVVDEDGNGEEQEDSATVQLDAEAPECEVGHEHEWTSDHAIVGGLKENPGVWGHGGGVKIYEACIHCGCARITDTWAQNPNNGTQGHTTVTYEPGKYEVAGEVEVAS